MVPEIGEPVIIDVTSYSAVTSKNGSNVELSPISDSMPNPFISSPLQTNSSESLFVPLKILLLVPVKSDPLGLTNSNVL